MFSQVQAGNNRWNESSAIYDEKAFFIVLNVKWISGIEMRLSGWKMKHVCFVGVVWFWRQRSEIVDWGCRMVDNIKQVPFYGGGDVWDF